MSFPNSSSIASVTSNVENSLADVKTNESYEADILKMTNFIKSLNNKGLSSSTNLLYKVDGKIKYYNVMIMMDLMSREGRPDISFSNLFGFWHKSIGGRNVEIPLLALLCTLGWMELAPFRPDGANSRYMVKKSINFSIFLDEAMSRDQYRIEANLCHMGIQGEVVACIKFTDLYINAPRLLSDVFKSVEHLFLGARVKITEVDGEYKFDPVDDNKSTDEENKFGVFS